MKNLFVALLAVFCWSNSAWAQKTLYSYNHHALVNSTLCKNAAEISSVLKTTVDESTQKYSITLTNGWVENRCFFDRVLGQITVKVKFSNGRQETLVSVCEENPATGFGGPTGRGCNDAKLEFVLNENVTINEVSWEMKNAHSGSAVLAVFQMAIELLAKVLEQK
jgi:hypothetical protein